MPSISVICPTIGRASVVTLIEAIIPQLSLEDEFILVGDGPQPAAKLAAEMVPRVRYLETLVRVGDFGCTPCDFAIERAKGDFVMFIGDDDLPTTQALEFVREGVAMDLSFPHIFSMMHTGNVLSGSSGCGQVSGQQLVVPRDMNKMPKMADCPQESWLVSDWIFIDKVIRAWGGVMFHEEIIAVLDRQRYGQ